MLCEFSCQPTTLLEGNRVAALIECVPTHIVYGRNPNTHGFPLDRGGGFQETFIQRNFYTKTSIGGATSGSAIDVQKKIRALRRSIRKARSAQERSLWRDVLTALPPIDTCIKQIKEAGVFRLPASLSGNERAWSCRILSHGRKKEVMWFVRCKERG